MICPKCSNEIEDDSLFCGKCEQKIKTINFLKTKKTKMITGIILVLMLISIGGYNYYSSLPPKNVKSIIYKGTLAYMQVLQQHKTDNWSMTTEDENKNLIEFCDLIQKDQNSTPEEQAIAKGLLELNISYISDSHYKFIGQSYGDDYNQKLKEIKVLLSKK